ncbi:MAG UNVERIFIED_CONTAM: hypothetical protein LVR18_49650 [Planctomycetaceae bacterium]|jgi:hypothetical protein
MHTPHGSHSRASLKLAGQGLLVELLLLLPGIAAIGCSLNNREQQPLTLSPNAALKTAPALTVTFLISLSLILLVLIPLISSAGPAMRGIQFILSDPTITQRTAVSLGTSVACSAAAAACGSSDSPAA